MRSKLKSLALLIRPVIRSKFLQLTFVTIAFLGGLDDAMEAWFGVADMLHLDVSHGLMAAGLSGVLKPLAELLEYFGVEEETSINSM